MTVPQIVAEIMPGAGPFDVAGDYYLNLTGTATGTASGAKATTPHVSALAITGDIDVRIDLQADSWTSLPSGLLKLIGKGNISANDRSWILYTDVNRRLVFRWTTNGTTSIDSVCTDPVPVTSGRLAVRVTLDVNDGAGNRVTKFYTAPDIDGSWTQLGTTITTAGTTSIWNSATALEIGDVIGSGFYSVKGRCYAAQVSADLTGSDVRANPNFAAQAPGTTSFTDAAGRVWSINSPATLAGFDWEAIPDQETGPVSTRQRLRSLSWDVGRRTLFDRFPATEANVVFRSNDRLLDPEYTAGQYYGALLPSIPVRFRSLGPAADLYYGFPRDGWAQGYDKPLASTCTVQFTDLLGVIGDLNLPGSAYDAAVLAAQPSAFWKQDETAGTQMADSSGYGLHGTRDNGEAVDPLVIGDGHGFFAPHVGDNRGIYKGGGLPTAPPATIEAWVKTDRDLTSAKTIVNVQRDAARGSALWLGIETSGNGSPNGELVLNFFGLGGAYKVRGSTRIDDDDIHHVVAVIGGTAAADILLYVDGELETKTTISGTTGGTWVSHLWWTVANIADNKNQEYGLDGTVDEVAIYPHTLTAAQVAEHYEAGSTAHDGDTTGERIDRVLDIIGIPPSLRDIATGDTTVGPAHYNSATVGEYLNKVVESEQGYLHIDHQGGGKIKFRGRYTRLTDSRSTTSQATFTDEANVPGTYCYRDEIRPEPNSAEAIINSVAVAWQGGTEIVTDDDSIASYGPRTRSITTEAPSPEAARSPGAWLVTRYGQPQSRIAQLPLTPGGNQTGLGAVTLDQQVSDRITVRRRPVNIGSPILNELIVEGIHHDMTPDGTWLAVYYTSNADDITVWIWGTSTWGETTVWG